MLRTHAGRCKTLQAGTAHLLGRPFYSSLSQMLCAPRSRTPCMGRVREGVGSVPLSAPDSTTSSTMRLEPLNRDVLAHLVDRRDPKEDRLANTAFRSGPAIGDFAGDVVETVKTITGADDADPAPGSANAPASDKRPVIWTESHATTIAAHTALGASDAAQQLLLVAKGAFALNTLFFAMIEPTPAGKDELDEPAPAGDRIAPSSLPDLASAGLTDPTSLPSMPLAAEDQLNKPTTPTPISRFASDDDDDIDSVPVYSPASIRTSPPLSSTLFESMNALTSETYQAATDQPASEAERHVERPNLRLGDDARSSASFYQDEIAFGRSSPSKLMSEADATGFRSTVPTRSAAGSRPPVQPPQNRSDNGRNVAPASFGIVADLAASIGPAASIPPPQDGGSAETSAPRAEILLLVVAASSSEEHAYLRQAETGLTKVHEPGFQADRTVALGAGKVKNREGRPGFRTPAWGAAELAGLGTAKPTWLVTTGKDFAGRSSDEDIERQNVALPGPNTSPAVAKVVAGKSSHAVDHKASFTVDNEPPADQTNALKTIDMPGSAEISIGGAQAAKTSNAFWTYGRSMGGVGLANDLVGDWLQNPAGFESWQDSLLTAIKNRPSPVADGGSTPTIALDTSIASDKVSRTVAAEAVEWTSRFGHHDSGYQSGSSASKPAVHHVPDFVLACDVLPRRSSSPYHSRAPPCGRFEAGEFGDSASLSQTR